MQFTSDDPKRPITNFEITHDCIPLTYIENGGDPASYTEYLSRKNGCDWIYNMDTDAGTLNLLLCVDESAEDASHCFLMMSDTTLAPLSPSAINYRWNQSFDLTFTVDEEE